jgi:hypothetical protein
MLGFTQLRVLIKIRTPRTPKTATTINETVWLIRTGCLEIEIVIPIAANLAILATLAVGL